MKKIGRAYSPKEKKACLKQLKEGKSFAQVSRESGVSASTLRKWSKEEESGGQESSSKQDAQVLGQMAKRGMRMNVDLLVRRLETACSTEREMEEIRCALRRLGPKQKGESEEVAQKRARLEATLENYYHLSDATAASFLRALMAVRAKTEVPAMDGSDKNYEALLKSILGDEF